MAETRTDLELLTEFAGSRSERAFQLLVERHIDLVFATALRGMGNAESAKDVAQQVFVALARKAPWLQTQRSLAAWLHKTALLEVRQWWRGELRRQRREQTAVELGHAMRENESSVPAMASVLDEALLHLAEPERQAVMLRYFEGCNYREIGLVLGTGEDAARKRVEKALDQLGRFFRWRGYALPAAGAAAILEGANQAAPVGLASLATQAGLATGGFTATGFGLLLGKVMALTKIQTLTASLLVSGLSIGYQWHASNEARAEQAALNTHLTELRQQVNVQEGRLATTDRKLRRVQRQRGALEQSIANVNSKTANSAPAIVYAWDEQSDYVRLPKSLAPKLTFAEFDWHQRGKGQFEREQRPALSKTGKPSSVLLDALGLTADEAQNVSEACREAFAEFASLSARYSYLTNANYSMSGETPYRTLYTPAFPEQGASILEGLQETLAQNMSPDRGELFLNQIGSDCRDALNDFGRNASAVTIARNQQGHITYGEMYFNPDGSARLNRAGPDLSIELPQLLSPALQELTAVTAETPGLTP